MRKKDFASEVASMDRRMEQPAVVYLFVFAGTLSLLAENASKDQADQNRILSMTKGLRVALFINCLRSII